MKRFYVIPTILLLALLAAACGSPSRDNLTRIIRLADTDHEAAAASLDSVDFAGLSEGARNLYSLAEIKIADKRYIKHISADEIERVLTYYNSHESDPFYSEALYYAGRVYSDMGNYPQAIVYFRAADESLPDDADNLRLKSVILSQTARLYDNLRLYDKAEKPLRKAIEIERVQKDSVSLVYDLDLLGIVYLHSGKYENARRCFMESAMLAATAQPEYVLRERMLMAETYNHTNDLDSALALIRGIPETISDTHKDMSLAFAADIYRRAGIKDTAVMYAHMLADMPGATDRKVGYKILLSYAEEDRVSRDSLSVLAGKYGKLVEDYLDRNGDMSTLLQDTRYNYESELRRLRKSEKSQSGMFIWLAAISAFAVCCLLFALRMRHVKKHRDTAIVPCGDMEDERPAALEVVVRAENSETEDHAQATNKNTIIDKDTILQAFEEETKNRTEPFPISPVIAQSGVYKQFCDNIFKKDPIGDTSELWHELEVIVHKSDSDFETRVRTLLGYSIDELDYRLCLLSKCGMRPYQQAIAVGRRKSTISRRRKLLTARIFGEEREGTAIDLLISWL